MRRTGACTTVSATVMTRVGQVPAGGEASVGGANVGLPPRWSYAANRGWATATG